MDVVGGAYRMNKQDLIKEAIGEEVPVEKLEESINKEIYKVIDKEEKMLVVYEKNVRKAYYVSSVYNLINKENPEILVPTCEKVGKMGYYSYLVTPYIKGKRIVKQKLDNILVEKILPELIEQLVKIHQLPVEGRYGWVLKDDFNKVTTLEEFLEELLNRMYTPLFNELSITEFSKVYNIAKGAIEKIQTEGSKEKPVLVWNNIRAENIWEDNGRITGITGAEEARYAMKEWDLAYIHLYFFPEEEQFEKVLTIYEEKGEKINKELLEPLEELIEIESLAKQMKDKTIVEIPKRGKLIQLVKNLNRRYEY